MSFDVIIVGAGSAGCVLAHRLSADPACKVLLLEAGRAAKKLEHRIPAAFYKLYKSEADWAFYTEPQAHLFERQLFWPRGKVLGGSSAINAMIYMRGNRRDYDAWAAAGNAGWDYQQLLPYFKRSQHFPQGDPDFHGHDGPWHIEHRSYTNLLTYAWLEAGVAAGFDLNEDFNGPKQEGIGLFQVGHKNGARHSAADAFLKPAMRRPNLTVWTGAMVHQVLLENTRATGVRLDHQGQLKDIYADSIILSSGAVQSPQLLLLSGIGPASELERQDIEVKHELGGVGKNLIDHLAVPVAYECRQPVSLDKAETLVNLARFLLQRRGPLVSNVAEGGGFVHSRAGLAAPDIQFHFGPAYFVDHGFSKHPGHHFTFGPTLIDPKSRGVIGLRSNKPTDPPLIQPCYGSAPEDLEALRRGIEIGREIIAQKAFDPYRGEEVQLQGRRDSASLIEHIKRSVDTLYHPMGSCKMGQDALAVVDEQLQVRGLDKLYVMDLSITPSTIRGNTNAAAMMIAEKGAELLLSR